MKTFSAQGTYREKGVLHTYTKIIVSENEKSAREKVFAEFGSKQRIPRKNIVIHSIQVK